MVVKTKDRGGSFLQKRFSVQTNDPENPRTNLTIVGKVKGYAKISRRYIRLMGPVGQALESKITIIPEKEYPFEIKKVAAKKGGNFRFDLKPLGDKPSKDGYELVVNNTKSDSGSYRDFILVETTLKEKPSFRIPVSGRIFGEEEGAKPEKK